MNLRDRRQPEKKLPDMNGNLQTDRSRSLQNWSDTTEKYKMLLEEQSGTIHTQKAIIREQEEIIRQQNLDIGEYESELSEKDSQILQAQELAQEWKQKAKQTEQDMILMEQNHSSQVSKLRSEIQNLSDKIVKLNGADLVLKENEKLEKQNKELRKSEREAREKAEKEVTHVKSKCHRKEQELERLMEEAEQERQNALTAHSTLQKLTDHKAKRLTEDARRQLQISYQAKKMAMQGYVGVLTIICFVTTVLSVIRQKVFCEDVIGFFRELGKTIQVFTVRIHTVFLSVAEVTEKVPNAMVAVVLKWGVVGLLWIIPMVLIGFGMYRVWKKYGEDIRKGIDVWNCSVSLIVLVGLVYFGDYAKRVVTFNLFGVCLLVDVLLVLVGWYAWGCRKYRGLC